MNLTLFLFLYCILYEEIFQLAYIRRITIELHKLKILLSEKISCYISEGYAVKLLVIGFEIFNFVTFSDNNIIQINAFGP